METFTEQKFDLPELQGISAKNIEEHLKLYAGYVKNVNAVTQQLSELSIDAEKNMYVLGELFRRYSFEYNGMRNHEVYFGSFVGGPKPLPENSTIEKAMLATCPSVDIFIAGLKNISMTRGVGWAVLWYDKKENRLLASWVDEQHLGQLNGCTMILAIDMWEHAYVYDYPTSEKKKYIEAFFENLNWEIIEGNFAKAI